MSMENNIFEIRIFANLAGFAEIKFGNTDTLSAGALNKDVLDSKRGLFQAGTFVVFYDESVYAIVKLVEAPAEAHYRDSRAYVCVAVRRGARLNEAKQVMDRLEEKFFKWASQYKENVAAALSSGKAELEQMVSVNIERDDDQPVYSVSAQQAIVSYGKKEELEDLLNHPFREQFAGLRALYILSQEKASEKWSELKGSFKAIIDLSYPYQRTYRLCYPDGQEETITGLEQEVKRICTCSHCASLTFEGKLEDHMEDWKITLNPEKTIYTIGMEFEPEQKKYTVVTKDEKGNSYKGMIYKASLGIIQGDTLTLKGEEIDKFESQRSVLTLQGRSDLEIVEQKVLEDRTQIAVTVKQLYKYDASTLWGIVESTVGHKQSISIALVNAKTDEVMFNFSKKDLSVYLDLPYDQAAYKVGETNKYKACTVFLKSDGTPGEYKPEEIKQGILPKASDKQEKKKLKVTIRIENQELDWEEKKVQLNLKYRDSSSVEREDIIFINKSSYSFEIPSDVLIWFTLQAKGYKKCTFEKDYIHRDTPKEGNEDVIPVTFKKLPYKKIAVLVLIPVVCLLLGFVLGSLTGKKQVEDIDGGHQYVELSEYQELQEEYAKLEQENEKLRDEIESLKENSLPQEPRVGDPTEPEIASTVPKVSEEKKQLIEKLKGIEFTQADIDKFKQMEPLDDEGKKLIKSCKACFSLLNALPVTKDNKVGKDKAKEQIESEEGFMFTKYKEITIKSHKDAMNMIILNKYSNAYKSVKKQNFKSINEAIRTYDERMN